MNPPASTTEAVGPGKSLKPIADDQIRQSVEQLWSSILGLTIEPLPSLGPALPQTGLLTGCIEISGIWQGSVMIDCGTSVARKAAAIMFGVESGQTSFDQVQDTLGELTNILGGQVKALLPEPCRLSLPAVFQEADNAFRGSHDKVLTCLDFKCLDSLVRVTIVETSH
jgi:chemotaxis protein CheX